MSRRKGIFSPKTPHFFKIILEETLSEEKLRIPDKFWRFYGETLDDKVFLTLPSGWVWEMKLVKHKGKFWLKTGWPEFADHYALKRGHLLVFRYEGNSKFHVVIFDTTTVEVAYPLVLPEEEVHKNDASPRPKRTGEKPPSQSPRPCKRMKSGPTSTKPQRDSPRPQRKGRGHPNAKTERKPKPLSGRGKLEALCKAGGFKSKCPFFKILMQPSYVQNTGVTVPSDFANKYFREMSDSMVLKVSGRRTWSVKYNRFETRIGTLSTRIWSGWQDFARDNRLKIGDVCVFVLVKGTAFEFKVVIFRDSGNSKWPISPDLEGDSSQGNEFVPRGTSAPKEMNEGMSMRRKTSLKPKLKTIWKKRLFDKAEKDRILERVRYDSGKPFFKVVIQPSYAFGTCMGVPSKFMKKYIKRQGNVVLFDTNGGSWPAQLVITRPFKGYYTALIREGWKAFAKENKLEVGDVCIFELIKKPGAKTSFKVSIIRVSEL